MKIGQLIKSSFRIFSTGPSSTSIKYILSFSSVYDGRVTKRKEESNN